MKTSSMTLRITIFFSIVLCLILSQNLSAQKGDLVLNFSGKDAVTSNIVPLESVKVSNETQGGDTTLYGAAPTLSLQWASGIFEQNRGQKASFILEPNYPNPFTESTTVNIRLRKPQHLIITLHDQQGAATTNLEQDFGFGTHHLEISVPQNRLCLLTVNDGVTTKMLKMFSTTGKDFRIKYLGTGENTGYKSETETAAFVFTPGDVLKYTVNAAGYYEYITYDNPATNMDYVFSLQPNTTELSPTVTTAAITNITATTATCGGNLTSEGSATVTVRGVCWNTSQNPSIANSFTADGAGLGSFTSTITGLTESTTYYVRAYATNQFGTAYGNEVSFTTATQELVYRCDSAISYNTNGEEEKTKYAYDVKGNMLLDLSQVWFAGYGVWVNYDQNLYTYDVSGSRLSELYQEWNLDIGCWVNSYQILYTYDTSGNRLTMINQEWNTNIGSWVNYWQVLYMYNAQGIILSELFQNWNTEIVSWVNSNQYLYTYDASGNTHSIIYQHWDTSIGNWVNSGQGLFTYDVSGNMLSDTWQDWDGNIGSWVNYLQILYSYDSQRNMLSYISQQWDINTGSWTNSTQFLYTYDASGNMLSNTYQSWSTNYGSWVNSSQSVYVYNSSGNMLSNIYQQWDTNIGSWVNYDQYILSYEASGNMHSNIYQRWNTNIGNWTNDSKTEYQYDYITLKITALSYEWLGGWMPADLSINVSIFDNNIFIGGGYKLDVWYNSYPMVNKDSDEAISKGSGLFGIPKPSNGRISISNLSEKEAGFENEFSSLKLAKEAWLDKSKKKLPSQNLPQRNIPVDKPTWEFNHPK